MKLFAFWKYATFPFVIGGEITRMLDNGMVETKQFGKGMFFEPFKILPLKEGEKKLAAFKRLKHEYDLSHTQFREEWFEQAEKIFFVP